MQNYYSKKLSGERLKRVYDIASPRVKQYLDAEIDFTLSHIKSTNFVLELGCGYGRVVFPLAEVAARVVGIDVAEESIELARKMTGKRQNCEFFQMNALDLRFPDDFFDVVICVQNGICAFRVNQTELLREAYRVTKMGGIILFSSYSDKFWKERLAWFEVQAKEGLIGEIDYTASKNGVIVCKDGFRAGRFTPEDFLSLCSELNITAEIIEVDQSSIFCKITKTNPESHI